MSLKTLKPYWHLPLVWVGQLLLLGMSIFAAYRLGFGDLPLALGIAFLQVVALIVLFMMPQKAGALGWVFCGAGTFWFLILLGLSSTDYLTRLAGLPQ